MAITQRFPAWRAGSVAALLFGLATTAWQPAAAADPPPKSPQVILLKLDDVVAYQRGGVGPVSPRWQRTAEFIEKSNLKASFGIIGHSLEADNPAYFDWINRWHAKGIEFWNHGYRNRKTEDKTGEFEGSLEEQTAALRKTQTLAREKLGFELRVFGAHWSGTNANTVKALAEFPDIKAVFYEPHNAKQFVFPRVLTLENPIFHPDPVKFKEIYLRQAKDKPCLALQGHADQWDDARWQGFIEIITFLKSRGCVFMTPSEYLAKSPPPATKVQKGKHG